MDNLRFILVVALSLVLLMLWQEWEKDYGVQLSRRSNKKTVKLKVLTCLSLRRYQKHKNDHFLEHLTSLKNLGFLDVSDTQVTDAGLEYLKSFKNCKTMRLSGTNVTDNGVTQLKRALTGCKITQ